MCVPLVNSTLARPGSGGLKPVSKYDKINLLFTLDILISPDWKDRESVVQTGRWIATGLGSHHRCMI